VNWSVTRPSGSAAAVAPLTVDARGAEIMLLCPRRRYGAMTRLLARHAREHGLAEGMPCLGKLIHGTLCKMLNKPHKVRYYMERRAGDC
jgi:hypothetical protein